MRKNLLALGATLLFASPALAGGVLWDNGPLVTHPGQGFNGRDASAISPGGTVFGFGHAQSTGFRVADDFTVGAGGWNINNITFFAYQTGSTETSTINHINLRIWDGTPGASNIVFGDTTTNRLTSTSFSNIYRVTATTLTNNQRPIMLVNVALNLNLGAGTYFLDWQIGGTLASGPWSPPVSDATSQIQGNAVQFDPNTTLWSPALDGSVQAALPFIIEGEGVPAPGALALLGFAGLAARRRRRA